MSRSLHRSTTFTLAIKQAVAADFLLASTWYVRYNEYQQIAGSNIAPAAMGV
ncbi:MAG: hypothetical protein AAF310_04820 [Myxococcota bacterium]